MIVGEKIETTAVIESIDLTESTEFDVVYAISSLAEEVCLRDGYYWSYEEMVGYVLGNLMKSGTVSVNGMLEYLEREVK